MERERSRLASNFDDEEKFRSTLWKVEKKKMHLTEQCKCGVSVDMKATYEYAQLMKEKLPIAKLKLEGLLKDVQESYCHHQHSAMLAHCQVGFSILSSLTPCERFVSGEVQPVLLQ